MARPRAANGTGTAKYRTLKAPKKQPLLHGLSNSKKSNNQRGSRTTDGIRTAKGKAPTISTKIETVYSNGKGGGITTLASTLSKKKAEKQKQFMCHKERHYNLSSLQDQSFDLHERVNIIK